MQEYISKYNELLKNKIFDDEFMLCSKIVKLYNEAITEKNISKKNRLFNEIYSLKNAGILNLIIEILPGIGGKESELFMNDILCMYLKYFNKMSFKYELLEHSDKEIVVRVFTNRYDMFVNEIGTHRVQRVPKTESRGRMQTSSVVVNVIPEYESKKIEIRDSELKIERMRASGPGGQNVNKVETAIRITHIATKISAQCQSERSQYKNLENAKSILFNRVKQYYTKLENDTRLENKNKICKLTDRSDKFRTYNYEQNRITDHRRNIKCRLEDVLNGNLEILYKKGD